MTGKGMAEFYSAARGSGYEGYEEKTHSFVPVSVRCHNDIRG